ncbi:MAG: hypothetical protein WCK00_16005, partial [Deltaproteobacteria bacterium]
MGRQGQGRFYEVAPALFRGTLIGSIRRSGRLTRIEMVEAAHLREFDHSPLFWSQHRPRHRAV